MEKWTRRVREFLLFVLLNTAAKLVSGREFVAVYDPNGNIVCAVGQPDEVHPLTSMETFECARLCDDNPECVAFNSYRNTTCEIFTCPSNLSRRYQTVASCRGFQVGGVFRPRFEDPILCGCGPGVAQDCADIRAAGHTESGIYVVYLGKTSCSDTARVYCDMNSSESWLVFQRRVDASVDFLNNWITYANGFGSLSGNFWLGNEIIYRLTANRQFRLRVVIEDWNGKILHADYSAFSVGPSSDYYRLNVSGYINGSAAGDSLSYHSGFPFSTVDADHDPRVLNCADYHRGAWWFNSGCLMSDLNGWYLTGGGYQNANGIIWQTYSNSLYYSLYMTEMKIAPCLV